MSLQLLTAVMEETCNFVRNQKQELFLAILFAILFIKLSQCSRRKQKPAPSAKLAGTARKKKDYDSDDTVASTEPGDMSNNEFSDQSYMTDASSRRAAKTSVRLVNKPIVRPPPGLTAPPGLTRSWAAPAGVPAWKHPDTRLNAGAQCFVPSKARMASNLNPESPCFVPSLGAVASVVEQNLAQGAEAPKNSQQLRQSIKMLKGALEDWESNLSAPSPAESPPLGPKDNLSVLQEALTKLSPEQANMVRTFLDQKVAADAVQQGGQKGPFTLSARTHPAGMPRPFTPFGGAGAPSEQVNQADAPKRLPLRSNCGFDESLKDHLRDLSELDTCARVLMVRRINRLGLDSPTLLKDYFKKFGTIERVMVAHTQCKVKNTHSTTMRVRPAPLGFVIMSTPEEANAALAQGTEHAVQPGVEIGAYPFESHSVVE